MPDPIAKLTDQMRKRIDSMSHEDMAHRWRFAPAGDPLFKRGEVFDYFDARFKALGGFTPELSKKIGLDTPDA